jgi:hypothetical protein
MDGKISSRYLLAFLVASLGLASCSRAVEMAVNNMSSQTISRLTVIAGNVSRSIEDIQSGNERSISIRPLVDSDLRLIFDTESQTSLKCELDTYLTKGMHGQIKITINENFSCDLRTEETTFF